MNRISLRPSRLRGLVVAACAMLSFALFASPAWADSPTPSSLTRVSLTVNPDGSKTLTVQGTWDWGTNGPCDSSNDLKAVGYAIDWNDVTQPGNLVASGVDVGTPTDNLVRPASNMSFAVCMTNSGAFGPLSHTYSATTPLPSLVCAVTYDVHIDKGQIATSGNHSTKAGGSDHNTDNSLEKPFSGVVTCQGVSSTPVTFRSASAQKVGKGVHVRWQTASEARVLGYNVYVERNGKRVKLNAKLIRAKGAAGGSYLFKATVPKGKFWLQTVNTDGSRLWRFVRAI